MSPDEPKIDMCQCGAFKLWYTDRDGPPIKVCQCGHPRDEHLDGRASCTGKIQVV